MTPAVPLSQRIYSVIHMHMFVKLLNFALHLRLPVLHIAALCEHKGCSTITHRTLGARSTCTFRQLWLRETASQADSLHPSRC